MGVEKAKQEFLLAKKASEDCQRSICNLQERCDLLEENLPKLNGLVESTEKVKEQALDDFALSNSKEAESRLERARLANEKAKRDVIETNELIGASYRASKKKEDELVRLNEECSQSKRAVWTAITENLKSKIPVETIEIIQQFALIYSTQLGGSFEFCLKSLCPQPGHEERIAILEQFRTKHGID